MNNVVKIICFLMIQFFPNLSRVEAQSSKVKKNIDNAAIAHWTQTGLVDNPISNDGVYILYRGKTGEIVLTGTSGNFTYRLSGIYDAEFTEDSKNVIYKKGDSVYLFNIREHTNKYLTIAKKIGLAKNGSGQILIGKNEDSLFILNISKGSKYVFNDFHGDFILDKNKSQIAVYSDDAVFLFDKQKMKPREIYRGRQISGLVFDNTGDQLAFFAAKGGLQNQICIVYYKVGMDHASVRVGDARFAKIHHLVVSMEPLKFNREGDKLFFMLRDTTNQFKKDMSEMDVWNYKDYFLSSYQRKVLNQEGRDVNKKQTYLAVNYLTENTSICLDRSDGFIVNMPNAAVLYSHNKVLDGPANYLLETEVLESSYSSFNPFKKHWPGLHLITVKNGERTIIGSQIAKRLSSVEISPAEKFVVWFDLEKKNYYTYEIVSGKTREISSRVPFAVYCNAEGTQTRDKMGYGIAGWEEGDRSLLIYDEFDIWKIDPLGIVRPVCITGGYGRKNRIELRDKLYINNSFQGSLNNFNSNSTVLLHGKDMKTYDEGIYKLTLNNKNAIEKLYSGPYGLQNKIRKALNSDTYLLIRENVQFAPNLFVSKDLINYKQLTNYQFHKEYNYITAELVHWKLPSGVESTGILYKPENLDSTKKYPIIFNYYEKNKEELFKYLGAPAIEANAGSAEIPIAYYVINGYLVFVPDMQYKEGHVALSATETVVSAAKYLCGKGWVDSTKMGLNGHSFGGYQTNCIIANSNIFAAASEGAGTTDVISEAGDLSISTSKLGFVLYGQPNLNAYYWERPDLYIENSPIFNTPKITTPLLMTHSKSDPIVSFSQSLELFNALRLLDKPVWLLQYDHAGHANYPIDSRRRQFQFFEHLLKGKPAPRWMTKGVSAIENGDNKGMELDPSGSCSKDCKICKRWNEKFKTDSMAVKQEIKQLELLDMQTN